MDRRTDGQMDGQMDGWKDNVQMDNENIMDECQMDLFLSQGGEVEQQFLVSAQDKWFAPHSLSVYYCNVHWRLTDTFSQCCITALPKSVYGTCIGHLYV